MVAPFNVALITVGNSDVRYAHLVEYGHSSGFNGSTVPPHPFFWPGLRLAGRKRRRRSSAPFAKPSRRPNEH